MVRCITGAKFTMQATLLRQTPDWEPDAPDPNFVGEWVDSQDPLTGEIVRVWEPNVIVVDDPDTPRDEASGIDIPCVARGYSTSNRFTSNRVFGDDYKNIDVIRMWVPAWLQVTKSDRITNIRDNTGHVLWVNDYGPVPQAVTFNVSGVVPQLGPFNRHTETFLILERVEAV